MTVEEILVEYGIVVGERFRQSRQSRCGNLLQRRFVSFMSNAADVERDTILGVRHLVVSSSSHDRRHHYYCTRTRHLIRYDMMR